MNGEGMPYITQVRIKGGDRVRVRGQDNEWGRAKLYRRGCNPISMVSVRARVSIGGNRYTDLFAEVVVGDGVIPQG